MSARHNKESVLEYHARQGLIRLGRGICGWGFLLQGPWRRTIRYRIGEWVHGLGIALEHHAHMRALGWKGQTFMEALLESVEHPYPKFPPTRMGDLTGGIPATPSLMGVPDEGTELGPIAGIRRSLKP